ncbi:MAG: SPOR domain-containing protein [Candidatus Omnitrophica bacterium]|nr:SPOR domain-containing protein [Candidatus Omnitrophota bacterium]MBL7210316.1 SPOR domain-containing protein [Candidatus Omnitrophota bacterium]
MNLLFWISLLSAFLWVGFPAAAYPPNLDVIKVHLLRGDYKSAATEGEKIMEGCDYSPDLDELYCLLAVSYLKDGNYLRASDIFEIILKEFKSSTFTEEAEVGLGDAYFLMGEYDKAGGFYKEFLRHHRGSKFKPQVFYRISLSAAKLGRTEEAKQYLEKLNQEYPFNIETTIEKDLGGSKELYYTVQVGAFSNAENAQCLMQELIQKGYPAYVEELPLQGKVSYRVRVGRPALRQEAVDLQKKLFREGYPANITYSRR